MKFYTYKFKKAVSVDSLLEWGLLVATVKSAISGAALQQLRDVYAQEKDLMQKFYSAIELILLELLIKF